MDKRRAFTLVELLVVIAIIALLMAILMPALNKAKEQGKRAVCLHNLKSLALLWIMYADDNDDRMVNGLNYDWRGNEPPWVNDAHIEDPVPVQIEKIKAGALFRYATNVDIYHCPGAKRDEKRTYSTVHAMNGLPFQGEELCLKKRLQMKRPSERIVFLDDYMENWDASWAVRYAEPAWWNPIPMRHVGTGTTLSFADGHSKAWKWGDKRSIEYGKMSWRAAEGASYERKLELGIKNPDLQRLQRAAWGKLGYTP